MRRGYLSARKNGPGSTERFTPLGANPPSAMPMRRGDVLVATLSFVGIVYLFFSTVSASSFPHGLAVCGLLLLPGLVLLYSRVARQPPFRGDVLL